jgi:hypothetical protein
MVGVARCTWHVRSDCNLVEGLGMSALSYGYCASKAHRWHDAKYLADHISTQRGYLAYQPGEAG